MDAYEPSPEQVAELAAELKKRFGPAHTLSIVHDQSRGFLIHSLVSGARPTTTINTLEPPVTRAIFKYKKAVAAEEHAVLTDDVKIRAVGITSAHLDLRAWVNHPLNYNEVFTEHLVAIVRHTSAMATHEHAADYVRFEHAKYSHFQERWTSKVLRGVALLTRAYIESAADRHGVDLDHEKITAGTILGRTDRRIIRAAKDVLDEVHRQRLRGIYVDVLVYTVDLDRAFSRLRKAYCCE